MAPARTASAATGCAATRAGTSQSVPSAGSQDVHCRQRHVQFGALFPGLQVAVEEPLDGAQALVEGLAGQAPAACGAALVARRFQVVAQGRQQVGAVPGVVIDEAAELSFGVFLDPGVCAQRVQQTAQADVGQFVEGTARGRG